MTMNEALDLFDKYCWDSTDKSYKDTVRYMGYPGQATTYMIGQLQIWALRETAERRLREANVKFDLKDFHYQILAQVCLCRG